MADIATLPELASALQSDLDTATANLLLLDLAQGLIEEEIGTRDPWPKTAKAIALAAAARSYRNPDGVKRRTVGSVTQEFNAEEMGVYLTDQELRRLQKWLNDHGGGEFGSPRGAFPESLPWPDPAEPLATTTSD
jgi:hypothetical protein